ncbi:MULTISPECIES: glutathione S-transferase family protein [Morganella]|uniref:Glutathione S-transferase family protein n=1 Tax=Morganella morganii TaxID=582 RepID=A0AAE4FAK2_MORMO|nr:MULTISPECIES: glutathione S-transferase family protein [Morganella]EJG2201962.1 glutathione S-transferase family protein [Morganella morganii]ELN8406241.1 glutathione S-transferase family protein [Morganella morganii]MBC3995686.1 glutathione S-transferase family protein [Morganella morganii]MBT0399423.1 glutathione S-transferase family protein [Morganella morganii subsp. morganii]MBX9344549.1 glutathione S-transferase family protein [Morganella morganii]
MITVWGRKNSSNVKKVLWCLTELGLTYQQKDAGGPFGGLDTPEYLAMNPNKTIPTYQDGEFILWESNAILSYLADKYDDGTLLPHNAEFRARAAQWMYWSDGSLFPYIKAMMGLLVRTPAEQRDPARVEELKQALNRLIAMLNDDLAQRDYIAGDAFSIADMALAPLLYPWREVCHDRPDFPHIERWFARIETRPAYRDIVALPVS